MSNIHDALSEIQSKLNAPKNQHNTFGKYNYRKAEDIIAAFKALGTGAALTLTDAVVAVGDKIFLKATAKLTVGEETVSVDGWAMHAMSKKGMDEAQITGSCSSYARKYALCGLFAIDDSEHDPDGKDNRAPSAGDTTKDESPDTLRIMNEMINQGVAAMINGIMYSNITSDPKWMEQLETLAQHDEPKHNKVLEALNSKKRELGIE
jgi:hypothetical protein